MNRTNNSLFKIQQVGTCISAKQRNTNNLGHLKYVPGKDSTWKAGDVVRTGLEAWFASP